MNFEGQHSENRSVNTHQAGPFTTKSTLPVTASRRVLQADGTPLGRRTARVEEQNRFIRELFEVEARVILHKDYGVRTACHGVEIVD